MVPKCVYFICICVTEWVTFQCFHFIRSPETKTSSIGITLITEFISSSNTLHISWWLLAWITFSSRLLWGIYSCTWAKLLKRGAICFAQRFVKFRSKYIWVPSHKSQWLQCQGWVRSSYFRFETFRSARKSFAATWQLRDICIDNGDNLLPIHLSLLYFS